MLYGKKLRKALARSRETDSFFGELLEDEAFVVTDEQGRVVLTFPFRLAIRD